MKITIDTKEDSHQELAKVIKLLQTIIGDAPASILGDTSLEGPKETPIEEGLAFTNLFAENSGSSEDSSEKTEPGEIVSEVEEMIPESGERAPESEESAVEPDESAEVLFY